jgi:hypothetical protein
MAMGVAEQKTIPEVRRVRSTIGRTGLLLVLVRTGEGVAQLARPLEHLSCVIRAIFDFILLGHLGYL